MSWTQDYCTVCDKQCPSGNMYCSRECLEAEASPQGSKSSDSSRRRSSGSSGLKLLDAEAKATINAAPSSNAQTLLIRQEDKFLYDSPLLKPQQTSLSVSPPLSPLLIAQGNGDVNLGASVGRLSQSSSSYRRWLQNEN
ncbi:hypothetical protein B9G98_02136 [Wickerhamiella sorbophila]|uniref:Uncharacterized protein n=1 Tax=Wickerhamiella sorbophila TaxID=45607 RepID=A0A2T0FHS1_9ASCO|nr:hypothetical protein B9G98_02136 [Wickerhamiella sorbophila]PRT54516.1 hypothetical protein B9G98_02136 [Wickerhamiella sorbophila]